MAQLISSSGETLARILNTPLQRSITIEQINANKGASPLRRKAFVRKVDEEARTVDVAFSSEEPVTRWFGDEVLDHSAGAMIDERLQNGAAVLWNHDTDIQIGVVERASIDGDRRGRATLRFGNSARANEIWTDVQSGIIQHISVGYFVRAIKTEESEGEPDKVTVTSWEPYEISLVSVPADSSVGVGRSVGKAPEEANMNSGDTRSKDTPKHTEGPGNMEKILRNAIGDLVRAEVDASGHIVKELEVLERASVTNALVKQGQEVEQKRVADLLELGDKYSAGQLAAEAIRTNESVDAFTRRLVDHVSQAGSANSRALGDNDGAVGLTDKEVGNFSFLRAFRALAEPTNRAAQEAAAFEFEASAAAETASNRSAQGIMVPSDVLQRALNTGINGNASGNTGGFSIATDLMSQSFIDMLRNRSILLGLATPMGGLIGNVDIPGQASGATGYWIGEDDDAVEGHQELRQIGLNPKTAAAYSEITRKVMQQSSIDAEALVRRDLARALALTMDYAGFYGKGSENQPLGIKNLNGINAVPFSGIQPTFAEIVQLETEVSADNADVDSMAYIANAKFRGHCKTTEKFKASSGATIWEKGDTVNGYRAEITNQVADGDVFHGNFSDMIAAMWGGLDLTIDPYSNSKKGRLRIVAFQDIDFAYRNVESFAYGSKPN